MQGDIPRHGGAREGAGRPSRDEAVFDGTAETFDAARAREMVAKAGLRELELETQRGTLVERVAVQQAAATAQQLFVQTVRGIRDQLEREGIPSDVAESVAIKLDDALAQLSLDMKAMCEMGLAK